MIWLEGFEISPVCVKHVVFFVFFYTAPSALETELGRRWPVILVVVNRLISHWTAVLAFKHNFPSEEVKLIAVFFSFFLKDRMQIKKKTRWNWWKLLKISQTVLKQFLVKYQCLGGSSNKQRFVWPTEGVSLLFMTLPRVSVHPHTHIILGCGRVSHALKCHSGETRRCVFVMAKKRFDSSSQTQARSCIKF